MVRSPGLAEAVTKRLFDSNILIDYLNGVEAARDEIDGSPRRMVSIVTWMEVLAGTHGEDEEDVVDMFLREFQVVDVTRRIARDAIALRRAHRLRLPDAIVWASARQESALLVTRDTKDFPAGDDGVRVPYTLTPAARPRAASTRRKASR